ncbi:hypothetical protein [Pseudoalteromonas sp. TB64]|uniref:hypothetical protein n=1 Tax=Pseudoalteromonas sp. TB64 TaxID=1938600 RepID=UPI00041C27A9|nr:hypothetical protein [Pseudoalteromonas sp. TB64]
MDSNQDSSKLGSKPFLEQFEEELFNSADSNNKIKIKEEKSGYYFLPPLQDSLELLNLPHTQKQLLDLAESVFETSSKIGRSSKFALFRGGVSPRVISKLVDFYKNLPIPFDTIFTTENLNKIDKSAKVGSNAVNWLFAIPSYKLSAPNDESDKELKPLFHFIEKRCETEATFVESFREKIKNGDIDREDTVAIYKHANVFWISETKVPKHAIRTLGNIVKYPERLKKPTKEDTLSVIESYCFMNLDFYLEAITYFEIGLRYEYGNDPQNLKNELGTITRSIYAFATNNNINTCFEALLIEYKKILTDLVGKTGFRDLARFIDINELENADLSESLDDRKYTQLKRWRNGKDVPSNERLAMFLDRIDEYANVDSGYVLKMAFRIALGVDKLVGKIVSDTAFDNCEPHEVEAIIKKVLSEIPTYYESNITDFLNAKKAG